MTLWANFCGPRAFQQGYNQESRMNSNQIDGVGKQIKGAVKEGAAKLTGNKTGQVEGKVEKEIGKAQSKLGNAQNRAEKADRDAVKR